MRVGRWGPVWGQGQEQALVQVQVQVQVRALELELELELVQVLGQVPSMWIPHEFHFYDARQPPQHRSLWWCLLAVRRHNPTVKTNQR